MNPWALNLVDRALSMTRTRFDRPIMNNVQRSEYVECLVAVVLDGDWTLPWLAYPHHDWAPWDLVHPPSCTKLEVKQSARRQPWDTELEAPSRNPSYDIAYRKRWFDADGIKHEGPARLADIYVFAWHPVSNVTRVDHRDAGQWEFFVLPTAKLPEQDGIGLTGLRERGACALSATGLVKAVRKIVNAAC